VAAIGATRWAVPSGVRGGWRIVVDGLLAVPGI
jgi:hypothetical protein